MNTAPARAIRGAGKSGETGIFKGPRPGAVAVTFSGLEGDVIRDTANHGGRDQAVYLYGARDYEYWSEALGRPLRPGVFGENLTVSGLECARLGVGDRLRAGTAVLQVTAPRIPCATLAARMGDPAFPKVFREAERPGAYCRVLEEGEVAAGEEVDLEPCPGETVSILEMFRDYFDPRPGEGKIRRYLAAPIAARARTHWERRLRELAARGASPDDLSFSAT